MRISFSTVILLLAIVAGTAWAGWWSIRSDDHATTIRFNKTEIRSDTAEIRENVDNVVRQAKHAVDGMHAESEIDTLDRTDG